MKIRTSALAILVAVATLPMTVSAQMTGGHNGKPMPSPPAKADVQLNGKQVSISYNSPRMRGRRFSAAWSLTARYGGRAPIRRRR